MVRERVCRNKDGSSVDVTSFVSGVNFRETAGLTSIHHTRARARLRLAIFATPRPGPAKNESDSTHKSDLEYR